MSYRHIYRRDDSDPGYQVWIARKGKTVFSRWISDEQSGGQEKALKNAIKVRDEAYRSLGIDPERGQRPAPLSAAKRSRSERTSAPGPISIHLSLYKRFLKRQSREVLRPVFEVRYREPNGKRAKKAFSISAGQYAEAFRKAACIRKPEKAASPAEDDTALNGIPRRQDVESYLKERIGEEEFEKLDPPLDEWGIPS
ncbi:MULTISPECIES: hypothetical protein [unclassified Thioalkalivibrio]|uniref:hypothetical protein n=1 Tax=unclassified Thioalkalivibrio TaxID=2621013 RepID=UPI00036BEE97|nr:MULTISPECIES: hypothetical protein [unclassified Thioalkalivibrio]